MKVERFKPVVRNCAIFLLLTLVFLGLQKALQAETGPMTIDLIQKTARDEWVAVALVLLTGILLIIHNKFSRFAFQLTVAWVSFRVLEGLFLDFNKLFLVLFFFFVILAYTFYQLLVETLQSASMNSNYAFDELHPPMGKRIYVSVEEAGQTHSGWLTNWDEQGCFVYLPIYSSIRRTNIAVTVHIEGRNFVMDGEVVARTSDGHGVGIEWKQDEATSSNWEAVTSLCSDFGHIPSLMR